MVQNDKVTLQDVLPFEEVYSTTPEVHLVSFVSKVAH